MNLIYLCVFHQESYIKLLRLLIESLNVKSNINIDTTHILIVTSPKFQKIIEKDISEYTLPIYYYTLELNTLFEAGCARLHIFEYNKITNYDKILYLDTDILINSDINVLFNIPISNDKLYALEEGCIRHEFWGGQLFNFSKIDSRKTGFTSGILFFMNSPEIKSLFYKIKLHISDYIYVKQNAIPTCLDQPFIVYNAVIGNNYDNQMMKLYVENNPSITDKTKIIYHFPGGPGNYSSKIEKMTSFWKRMNRITPVLFQTNKTKQDDYVVDMIKLQLGDNWSYEFYDDNAVLDFFANNPIQELPDIVNKYNSFNKGAHRADLFRYYYLYLKGGFFMDSDAMIYSNIEDIVKDYDFVSVRSSCHPHVIFQGVLGASPRNEIIKRALFSAYNTTQSQLDSNYFLFCEQLSTICRTLKCNIKLLDEKRIKVHDDIIDENNKILFKHYWKSKIIPRLSTEYINSYTWENSTITFLKDGKMNAFGKGSYTQIESHVVQANFGSRQHTIVFNDDYSRFKSTRSGDNQVVEGVRL